MQPSPAHAQRRLTALPPSPTPPAPAHTPVFVYGSLLPGLHNARLLDGSALQGYHVTAPEYDMYALGSYPCVCSGGGTAIHGAVYLVGDATLALLDQLEGHPHWYCRELVALPTRPDEPVWMYVMPRGEVGMRAELVASGDWRGFMRHRARLHAPG